MARPAPSPSGNQGAPPALRFPGAGRDALLGLLLAVACAGILVAAVYAALTARGAFSDPPSPEPWGSRSSPSCTGEAPSWTCRLSALLGIGGSVRLGLPITSFALVPFLLSLLAGRLCTQEEMDQGISLNGGSLLQ